MMNTLELALKMNTLELARHHRKHCEGESCCVSLIVLQMMAEKCGVVFSEEEKGEFA